MDEIKKAPDPGEGAGGGFQPISYYRNFSYLLTMSGFCSKNLLKASIF
jgi:hypothetical protein